MKNIKKLHQFARIFASCGTDRTELKDRLTWIKDVCLKTGKSRRIIPGWSSFHPLFRRVTDVMDWQQWQGEAMNPRDMPHLVELRMILGLVYIKRRHLLQRKSLSLLFMRISMPDNWSITAANCWLRGSSLRTILPAITASDFSSGLGNFVLVSQAVCIYTLNKKLH
jgi:hypothetical protein